MTSFNWPSPRVWADSVRESFRGPWPGARPLTEDDAKSYYLAGRDDDISLFSEGVDLSNLTHLLGETGVGKTSLLYAGIIPYLRSQGYVIATCRDWNKSAAQDFDEYLATALYESLPEETQPGFSSNTDIFWEFADLAHQSGRAFIVLDQFEELLRRDRHSHELVFGFLQDAIAAGVVVVLSYRSEYKYLMEPLDHRVQRKKYIEVKPISDSAVREIIEHPRRPEDASPNWTFTDIVSPEAVDRISTIVDVARGATTGTFSTVGLLHVQALLYVLWMRAIVDTAESQQPRITGETLDGFLQEAVQAGNDGPVSQLNYALEESATIRLAASSKAAADLMDEYMIRGISETAARIVPHLSSGGYKLARKASDLAGALMEGETRQAERALARVGCSNPKAVTRQLVTLFSSSSDAENDESVLQLTRDEIFDRLADPYGLTAATWREASEHHQLDMSAGPLLGLGALSSVIERLRRFGWALVWLDELNLARMSPDPEGNSWVELVHDGFGEPLERWGQDFLIKNATWGIFALTLPEGESHEWGGVGDFSEDLRGTVDAPKVIANLGFKGNSIIGGDIRHAVFANCDFRGTLFMFTRFEGVTFLNCRLDGALFSDCLVHGAAPTSLAANTTDDGGYEAPVFQLPDSDGTLAATLRLYRELPPTDRYLVSDLPGSPATVSEAKPVRQWQSVAGGLRLQGSQVSALTFRGTAFQDGAALLFEDVRGAGLDLVELAQQLTGDNQPLKAASDSPADIRFSGCALRHVAFTARGSEPTERTLTLRVSGCAMAQWWVGAGFSGSMTIEDSLAGQVWVESSPDFPAVATDGTVAMGLVGVTTDASVARIPIQDESLVAPDGSNELVDLLGERTERMEYRR